MRVRIHRGTTVVGGLTGAIAFVTTPAPAVLPSSGVESAQVS